MSHQVFIERCKDRHPAAEEMLARAVASKYGVDPQQILGRLQQGRFRVKANLDLVAAQTFMAYLESEGALCSIIGPSGEVVARSAEVTPAPPSAVADDDFLALHTPPPAAEPATHYESGLAAGFGDASGTQDLGALDDAAASSGTLRLSMLDGDNSEEKKGPSAGSVADASDVAAFLPPDALKESVVELADERPEIPEALSDAPPASSPSAARPVVQFAAAPEHSQSSVAQSSVAQSSVAQSSVAQSSVAQSSVAQLSEEVEAYPSDHVSLSLGKRAIALLLLSARGRLALGVFLAFMVGFGISSTVAGGMEESQYAKALETLNQAYAGADTTASWNALDGVRETAVKSLERRRRNIVVTSLLVWLVAGGLLLFLWLRIVNWERVERSLA